MKWGFACWPVGRLAQIEDKRPSFFSRDKRNQRPPGKLQFSETALGLIERLMSLCKTNAPWAQNPAMLCAIGVA